MTAAPAERPDKLLIAATWWANQGVPVFPLYWPEQRAGKWQCSCGDPCAKGSPAKHPLTPHGLDDATTDLEQIRAWWKRWPKANIGLRTGVAFDLLDIDGPEGFANLQAIVEQLGGEPQAAAVVVSGRIGGGRHYYMQPAGKKALSGGKSSPAGIDVKGNGGYAVGPPSVHVSGAEYRWGNGLQYGQQTGTVPWDTVYQALVQAAPKKERNKPPAEEFSRPAPVGGDSNAYGRKVLNNLLEEMRGARPGHRWDTFAVDCASTLARAIAGGCVDRHNGISELQSAARATGLSDGEVDRLPDLIDDLLAKGVTDPIKPSDEPIGPSRTWTAEENEQTPWEPPQALDLRRPPFPVDELGPLAGYVSNLAEHLQTPVDLVGMLALATISATVRGRAIVRIDESWTEPLNLYVAVLAGAGETKSPVLSHVAAPLRAIEKELQEAAREPLRAAEQARRLQEGRLGKAEKAAVNAVGDDRGPFEEQARIERETLAALPLPVLPRILAGDMTAEGLVRLLAEQGGVLASLSAEGGLFDTLAGGRYSSGMANLDAVLQAHDGREPILVDRKVGDPLRVEHPCLTLGLAVQPQVLAAAGKSEAAAGRGFFARFLFSYPESRVGSRTVYRPRLVKGSADIADVVRGVDRLLTRSSADIADVALKDELRLPSSSLELLQALLEDLEPRRHPHTGDLAGLGAWANKLNGQIARLAGLLALIDLAMTSAISAEPDLDRPAGAPRTLGDVHPGHIASAYRIAEYLIEHAIAAHRLISGQALTTSPAAAQLLGWLRKNGHAEFTCKEAFDSLRRRVDFPNAETVQRAALDLEAAGYLRQIVPDSRTPGRPSTRYAVNPLEPK